MDDVVHTLTEMFDAYEQLKNAFSSAKFNLRKWCSNSPEFLEKLPKDDCELKALVENVGALGVSWSPLGDYFSVGHNTIHKETIIIWNCNAIRSIGLDKSSGNGSKKYTTKSVERRSRLGYTDC